MRTLKFITVLAVVLALTAFAVNVELFDPTTVEEPLDLGEKNSDFYLQDSNGEVISLEECSKAKGYILIFTADEDPYAATYEEKFIALNKKYKKLGYPVILINPNEPTKDSEDNIEYTTAKDEEEEIKYLYLLDEDQKVLPHYTSGNDPLVYVLQKEPEGFDVKFMGAIEKPEGAEEVASNENPAKNLPAIINPEG